MNIFVHVQYYVYNIIIYIYTHVIYIWKIICHKKRGLTHLDQPLKNPHQMKRSNARMNDAAGAFWKIERRGVTKVREVDTCGDLLITQVEVTFSPLKGSLKTPKKIQKGHWEGLVMMKKYSTIDVLILTELLRILSVVKVKNLNCIAFEVQSMSSLKDGTCNKNTIRKIRRTHDWWDSF